MFVYLHDAGVWVNLRAITHVKIGRHGTEVYIQSGPEQFGLLLTDPDDLVRLDRALRAAIAPLHEGD